MSLNQVKLVAVTSPNPDALIEQFDYGKMTAPNAQDLIAYCARVSNPSNQGNLETAEKLLGYCLRKKHWSPFEMVNVVLEINTSRTIARQILRHRSFSFQEFSQRYADPTQMKFLNSEPRLQDHKNRQNSIHTSDDQLHQWWTDQQQKVIDVCKQTYSTALEHGIAKEVARNVLPEGLTPSRMYMNGTLRSWIHFCDVRRGNDTQKEHREIAEQCWDILVGQFNFLREHR